MPKHRKKKTISATEPYTVNKKATDQALDQTLVQDTSETLYCDKCSQSVDQLIQCERAVKYVWFCGACENIPAQTMKIIIAYKQIHWLCHVCNDQTDQLIQKSHTLSSDQSHTTDTDVSSCRAISQIVTESLNKVTEQFTKTLKDVKDYIKMSLDEKSKASAAAATVGMDTSQINTQSLGSYNQFKKIVSQW